MKWHMASVYPHMAECKADCIQSEAANTRGKYLDLELQAWKEHLSDRDYAVGAVTPYNGTETSEDVDRIVEKALGYVPAEKLAITSDEGLAGNGFMTRRGAMHKMRMLSEAAAKARKKLNA
jgi:methionine synthase II (cobalamin-independent)